MTHLGNNNNAASQKEAAIQMKVPITVKAYNYEDPSSTPAISMMIEKPENEISIITRYFTKFSMLLLYYFTI